jgi:hypothetical protein
MDWIDILVTRPKEKQDCVVLTEAGAVSRALAHKSWGGGFCCGDGQTGVAVQNVTHWVPFKSPSLQ